MEEHERRKFPAMTAGQIAVKGRRGEGEEAQGDNSARSPSTSECLHLSPLGEILVVDLGGGRGTGRRRGRSHRLSRGPSSHTRAALKSRSRRFETEKWVDNDL